MQTLEQCYEKLSRNPQMWSYYQNPDLCILHTWKNCHAALAFIENYFSLGEKGGVFQDAVFREKKEDLAKGRGCHIISAFLLGLKIAQCLKFDFSRDDRGMNFKYYWFLTCLYHDIGYVYEDTRNNCWLASAHANGFKALEEICNIQFVRNRVFKTYRKDVVELYFQCRANPSGGEHEQKLDHGIVGGLLLYDKLRKQFEKAWKNRTVKSCTRESFCVKAKNEQGCLHVSNSHFDAYARAADAIITHNIFKETLEGYIKTQTRNFSNKRTDKITIKNKLCFILSLADTFEPFKAGRSLETISIKKSVNKKGFVLQFNGCDYETICKKVNDLQKWVEIQAHIRSAGDNVLVEFWVS
jgi:hypothetical protein